MNIDNDRTRPNPGALCEQADKKKTIHKINDLLFFMDKSGEIYNDDPLFQLHSIEKPSICIIFEFLLRYFAEVKRKPWYLMPEQMIASRLETFVVRYDKFLESFFLLN